MSRHTYFGATLLGVKAHIAEVTAEVVSRGRDGPRGAFARSNAIRERVAHATAAIPAGQPARERVVRAICALGDTDEASARALAQSYAQHP